MPLVDILANFQPNLIRLAYDSPSTLAPFCDIGSAQNIHLQGILLSNIKELLKQVSVVFGKRSFRLKISSFS